MRGNVILDRFRRETNQNKGNTMNTQHTHGNPLSTHSICSHASGYIACTSTPCWPRTRSAPPHRAERVTGYACWLTWSRINLGPCVSSVHHCSSGFSHHPEYISMHSPSQRGNRLPRNHVGRNRGTREARVPQRARNVRGTFRRRYTSPLRGEEVPLDSLRCYSHLGPVVCGVHAEASPRTLHAVWYSNRSARSLRFFTPLIAFSTASGAFDMISRMGCQSVASSSNPCHFTSTS